MKKEDSQEYVYTIKVPMQRVAVIIGKQGQTKKELEDLMKCELEINSQEGDVTIICDDAIKMYNNTLVIKAIARGFNPDKAVLLLSDSYILEIIELNDYVSENQYPRLRSRVIGTKGSTRATLEEKSGAMISIFGKTIAIIGKIEEVSLAKYAVEMLLKGAKQTSAYKYLDARMADNIKTQLESKEYFYQKFEDKDIDEFKKDD
ncbi:MAG: KH domain-containing protein [Candidatus Nanoarchaeia archaeon]|nr:KH domain-containing protein [Candidatus Nanoarchaeia archaeon]